MGVEADRADVEPALRDELGEPSERRAERCGLEVRVHEDERPPRVHGDGCEREAGRVEARLALGPRRPPERAVEVVRPRVVGALQGLAAAGALDDEVRRDGGRR